VTSFVAAVCPGFASGPEKQFTSPVGLKNREKVIRPGCVFDASAGEDCILKGSAVLTRSGLVLIGSFFHFTSPAGQSFLTGRPEWFRCLSDFHGEP
jgi:hypothetical protein